MTENTDTGVTGDPTVTTDAVARPDDRQTDDTATERQEPQADQGADAQGDEQELSPEKEAERLAKLDLPTEDDKAGKPLDEGVWGKTGHYGADAVLMTLQNVGLSTGDAQKLRLDAAMSCDPALVDQKALAAKIGPRRAKEVMAGLEGFIRDMRPEDSRVQNDIHTVANGPNAFRRLIEAASERLSASEIDGYAAQLRRGGASARRAVEALQDIVAGEPVDPDRATHTQQYAKPSKTAAQTEQRQGMSSKEYLAATEALHSGGVLSWTARDRREAELREARRIGRQNGIA